VLREHFLASRQELEGEKIDKYWGLRGSLKGKCHFEDPGSDAGWD
jgi:hypothetical protein